MVTEPRNRPINGAVCSYTAPNSVFSSSAASTSLPDGTWSTVVFRHEQEWKLSQDNRRAKGKQKQKSIFLRKDCKLSALCHHKWQNRKKGGWMEEHTKKRTAEDSSYIPLPQHHLSAQPSHLNDPATLLWQNMERKRSIINPTYFRCLPISDCLFPVTEYGWLTLTSRILQMSELN